MSYHCPICEKEFEVLYPNLWRYKRGTAKGPKYFCTYSCVRKYDEDGEHKKMSKLTLEQKKKAVQIALDGGDPLKYLDDAGAKDKYSAWHYIKKKLLETDPETHRKLIEKQNAPTVKVTGGLRIETPEADMIQVVETPEKPEAAKITKPVNYDGYDVTAISCPDLGELYYDKKHKTIDWRTESGDEISLAPWLWKKFYDELPKMLAVLGVDLNDQGDT